jgi:hypothetical protein
MGFWSKLRSGDKAYALVLSPTLKEAEIKTVKRETNALIEDLGDRQYAVSSLRTINIKIGKKTYSCYLADALKGVTCDLSRDESVLNLRTYPELASSVWDSRLLQWGFRLQPNNRMVAVAFILGGLLFGFFALLI